MNELNCLTRLNANFAFWITCKILREFLIWDDHQFDCDMTMISDRRHLSEKYPFELTLKCRSEFIS